MSWRNIIKKEPKQRVSTTVSTGQDEEAAQRTKENEPELLARIEANNKKFREDVSKQPPMEEMPPPPPPPMGGPMPPPPPMDGMGMPPPMGMPMQPPPAGPPVVNPTDEPEFAVDPEEDDDEAEKTGIRIKKWFSILK